MNSKIEEATPKVEEETKPIEKENVNNEMLDKFMALMDEED